MSRSTTRIVLIFLGLTGSGKTYLAEQYLPTYPRPVLIIDVMDEWSEYGQSYRDVAAMYQDVAHYLATGEGPPGGIFVLKADRTDKAQAALEVADRERVPGTYVLDELHRHAPKNQDSPLLEMVRTGRHKNQSVVGITQRPQSVHTHAVEEGAVVCFRLSGRAADHAARYLGNGLDAEALQRLEKREYVLGGRAEGLPERVDLGDPDGSVWTYDPTTSEIVQRRETP